jgi:hypothetical protein
MVRISFDGYPPILLTKDIIDGVQSVITLRYLAETSRKIGRTHRKLIHNNLIGLSLGRVCLLPSSLRSVAQRAMHLRG